MTTPKSVSSSWTHPLTPKSYVQLGDLPLACQIGISNLTFRNHTPRFPPSKSCSFYNFPLILSPISNQYSIPLPFKIYIQNHPPSLHLHNFHLGQSHDHISLFFYYCILIISPPVSTFAFHSLLKSLTTQQPS